MNQIAFVPGKGGAVTMVSYALYTGTPVYVPRRQQYVLRSTFYVLTETQIRGFKMALVVAPTVVI